jgi:hypothetical protein
MKRFYLILFCFAFYATKADCQTISFVMFDNVKAYEKDGGVQIEWTNLTERDLHFYIIERSIDGESFDTIEFRKPMNNHNDRADYTVYDESPKPGVNLYRVRVAGTSGRSVVSTLLKVEIAQGDDTKSFNLYPNPVVGDQLSINIVAKKKANLIVQVFNITGCPLLTTMVAYQGRVMTETLRLPPSLRPGIYTLLISDGEWNEKKIFIRK